MPAAAETRKSVDRLFLFNSAYRHLYFANVLNTLAYPRGTTNEYRYTDEAEDGRHNVDPSACNLTSIACTIAYVDRWSPQGYRYIPMRNGVLRATYADGDRRHYRVELGGFPNGRVSQEDLLGLWTDQNPPQLKENNPEALDDGHYALVAKTSVEQFADDQDDVAAWERIVKQIAQTEAFTNKLNRKAVFVRIQIADKKGRSVAISSRGTSTAASTTLKRSGRYSLDLTYRYPSYAISQRSAQTLKLQPTENVRILGSRSIPLSSTGNHIVIPFHFERFTKNDEGSIHLEASDSDDAVPTLPLIFRATHSIPAYLWLSFAIVLILAGAFIMAIDPTICDQLGPAWRTAVGVLLQLVAVFVLIRNFGEKLI